MSLSKYEWWNEPLFRQDAGMKSRENSGLFGVYMAVSLNHESILNFINLS